MKVRTDRVGSTPTEGARALWAALRKLGWTQADLAERLGTSTGNVNRWLHADRVPSRKYARLLEELAGIDSALWDVKVKPSRPLVLRPTGS